jgi:uncharacterized membrane protein YdbT with pleckstrin-like domain
MNPQQPTQPTTPTEPDLKVNNPLAVMQPDEKNICEIKRHPIGILGINVAAVILMIVVIVLAFGIVPAYVTALSKTELYEIGTLVFLVFLILTGAFVIIANRVYKGNRWILTSDSLTQVIQTSLFDKQSSQLSLGNLEDVTAEQDGILCHMFNYGQLRIETAGDRAKFVFPYCPNPTSYAQEILAAREKFEQGRSAGSNMQRLYREEGSYPQPTDAQPPAAPTA